jgi:hypothetical protein
MWTDPPSPATTGNLALKGERPGPYPQPTSKRPTLRLVPGRDRASGLPASRLNPLVLAIGVSLTFCLLWILVVFILYRIVRFTL